jgi:hypothetical protein
MEKSHDNGCCKDEIRQLKISDDQAIPDQVYDLNVTQIVSDVFPCIQTFLLFATTSLGGKMNSPPLSSTPIFILNRVFRI